MEGAATATEARKRQTVRGTAAKGMLPMLSEQWVGRASIPHPLHLFLALVCLFVHPILSVDLCLNSIIKGVGSNHFMVSKTHMALL